MNFNKQSEVEVLKEELNFLTDLLQEHKTRSYYQRPQFYSVPYSHPNVYNKKRVESLHHNSSTSIYKSKYIGSGPSFKNHFDGGTSKITTSRSFVHKPEPVPVVPKQNNGYSAKQNILWQHNKDSNCTQNISSSSLKIVRTSSSSKVTNTNSKTVAITNNGKVVPSTAGISGVGNAHSSGVNGGDIKPGNSQKSPINRNDHLQPLEENVVSKHPKVAKVSYVSCSDCIIEISEYENGELHINQKKLDPSIENNTEKSAFTSNFPSTVKKSKSAGSDTEFKKPVTKALSGTVCADNQHISGRNSNYQKPFVGSDSNTALQVSSLGTTISNVVQAGKLPDVSSPSQGKSVSSSCKFTKSQHPCERNAKYIKVNTNASKSQNQVVKHVLKNKYSVKMPNVVKFNSSSKCKVTKGLKEFSPLPVKCAFIPKSKSQKHLVNYPVKRTLLLPVKNANKRTAYTSYSSLNSLRQSHIRSKATKSGFLPLSYAKISKKAKAVNAQNVYKVVNKSNPLVGKTLKGSQLSKTCQKSPLSVVQRCSNNSSDKKWSKISDSVVPVAHNSLSAVAVQNPSPSAKNENKKVLPSSLPHKTSECEIRTELNTSKLVSRHSLQRITQRKCFIKKPSLNPSPKSFSDSHSSIKKAKQVRLKKTTYKVVNRYASHVSQVVQMIKTKYRTVNKRSASNSHLKWLHQQKQAYSTRKLEKSLHLHTKPRWNYQNSLSSAHHARKHLMPHSKASRKHSLQQKRVLKNIRGTTYKVSKTQIKKSFTPKRTKKGCFALRNKNSVIVNVRGSKFQVSPGGKSLKRLGTGKGGNKTSLRRIKIGGFTYIRQKESSVKSSATQNVASRMLHRSINTVRAAEAKKALQKSNVYCMFFNRFGRCDKKGICPFIHDPSKIAVCTRFLRGTCKKSECPFSHEVSPGKMAICSFFLQGSCTNSYCPYRHTSIKPGTKLCKAFVKGYCNKGSECQDAHILACPQYMCEGFCEKESSCVWPHPPMKKNIKRRNNLPEADKEIKEKDAAVDDISDQRYFTYEPGLVSDKCKKHNESFEENIHINKKVPKVRNKKVTFPKQPAFIPLLVSDEEL